MRRRIGSLDSIAVLFHSAGSPPSILLVPCLVVTARRFPLLLLLLLLLFVPDTAGLQGRLGTREGFIRTHTRRTCLYTSLLPWVSL